MTRPDFEDDEKMRGEEEAEPEADGKPKININVDIDFARYLGYATSYLGLTAIAILSFHITPGIVRISTILAYAMSTALMISLLIIMFVGIRWGSKKFGSGALTWAYWLVTVPLAFIYYILMASVVYGKLAPALTNLMKSAMGNMP